MQADTWVIETLAKKIGLEIIVNGQDVITVEVNKTYAVAQTLLEEKLGGKPDMTLRIFLCDGRENMEMQLVGALGKTKKEAASLAHSYRSIREKNTLLIDTKRANSPESRTEIIAHLVMSNYLQAHDVNLKNVYWLSPGLSEWLTLQMLDRLELRSAAQSLELRKKDLQNAKNGIPMLSGLLTSADWKDASKTYGETVVKQFSGEATDALLKKNGLAGLVQWIDSGKKNGETRDAFTLAFGDSTDAFNKNFKLP